MYELIIIGGGPAGAAAGVYAARKKIKYMQIAKEWGGQSVVSADVQNWIGTKSVSGIELGKMLEEHVKAQKDAEVVDFETVEKVEAMEEGGFVVKTQSGKSFESKFVLLCTGSVRRKLGVPGEADYDGKGVAYCSICDAPLFQDKIVAVVGGGNAGLEAVLDLHPYASKIYLLEFADTLKGDKVTQDRITRENMAEIITMSKTKEITGEQFVTALTYVDRNTNEEKKLDVEGVFIEVGMIPNTDIVKDIVDTNKYGEVVVNHKTQQTSKHGIWAAGDASDVTYKQNNISAGDAVKAVLNIYDELNKEKAKKD